MRLEIGSFIGLDLRDSGEYYSGNINIARLNSARAGIFHACKLYGCNSIYIPYYLCPTVKRFLLKNGIEVKSYYINERFEPLNLKQEEGHAVLLVNYFGLLSVSKIRMLGSQFKNVIVDNSAAFFCDPVEGYYNVYSPRKFFGVPDGCYVIGNNADKHTDDYKQDISSVTASFLLKTIEFGTSSTYNERIENEERIDKSDLLNMSVLTRVLLKNIDYSGIKRKRKENFFFAHTLYKNLNLFDPSQFMDAECAPMVYPLVVEDLGLAENLRKKKIFVGRLWKDVLSEVSDYTFEAKLSKYLIPIPIDQRYGKKELLFVYKTIRGK